MSEVFVTCLGFIIYAFMFAWFFKDAIKMLKDEFYFGAGLNIALCIWEAVRIVELALKI